MSNTSKNMPTGQHAGAPDRLPVTPDDVRAAAEVIRCSVLVTECDRSRTLSEICGCNLWLKFENLQFTSTFKEARPDRQYELTARLGRFLNAVSIPKEEVFV